VRASGHHRSSSSRACLVAALAGALSAWPGSARAQADAKPSMNEQSRADATFNEARRLLEAGHVERACQLFEESAALEPSAGTLLNVGDCREQRRDLAGAFLAFQSALVLAAKEPDAARRSIRTGEAQRRMDLLRPRISMLVLRSSPTPAALVQLDGRAIEATGQAQPLNPGVHELQVSAPGHQSRGERFETLAGQALEFALPALSSTPPDPDPRDDGPSRFGIAPYLVTGAGAALLATSVVTGQMASSRERRLDDECAPGPAPRSCPGLGGTLDDAHSLALATDVLWISGALIAGTGIALFVWDADPEPSEAASLSVHCFASGCSLSGQF